MSHALDKGVRVIPPILLLVILSSVSLSAETMKVAVGDTLTVSRNTTSTFQEWEVDSFDGRKISHQSTRTPDTIGSYQFQFRALEAGEVDIEFSQFRRTSLFEQEIDQNVVTVNILSPDDLRERRREQRKQEYEQQEQAEEDPPDQDQPAEPQRSQPEQPEAPSSSGMGGARMSQPSQAAEIDPDEWERISELVDLERYQAARDAIQSKLDEADSETAKRWRNLLAKSHYEQGNYQQASQTWGSMIEGFDDGPVQEWLLSKAKAHREAGNDRQAELDLLKIKHRHNNTQIWPEAMVELGEIARTKGELKRSKQLLQQSRNSLQKGNNPALLLRLAELYDQNSGIRDYLESIKLYRQYADRVSSSKPDQARQARERADYLEQNYVNFGSPVTN